MGIRIGGPSPASASEPTEGQVLFELLATRLRNLKLADQMKIVEAIQGDGWDSLPAQLQHEFDTVGEAFLDDEQEA